MGQELMKENTKKRSVYIFKNIISVDILPAVLDYITSRYEEDIVKGAS